MSIVDRSLEWTSEFDADNRERIHRKLVHKSELIHVFVERIETLPQTTDGLDRFLAPLVIDIRHPFFFEHPLDHVPGLMLIEGTRQVGTAISHLFYDVSFDLTFILNCLEVRFTNFAELTNPVSIQMTIVEKAFRRQHLNGLTCQSQWMQNGRSLGTMDAKWSFSSPAVLMRLRHGSAPFATDTDVSPDTPLVASLLPDMQIAPRPDHVATIKP
ncbi:AfsA-related hotdog domain-containing protein [Burkholderia sp. AW49-1]